MAEYRSRLIDRRLAELSKSLPAVMLVGPRATGKTTSAGRMAATTVRLDRPAEAAAFIADPDAALARMPEPVLLDEWQVVPGVLGAVKRAVDAGSGAGRFLLTGSVRADLEAETWPATGRVVRIPMYGLTIRELVGAVDGPTFVDKVASPGDLPLPDVLPDLAGYVDLALAGGFPEPVLELPASAGPAWLDGYVDSLLTRDLVQLGTVRDPVRLRRYLEAYALNSAGVPSDATLLEAAGINHKTATAYEQLLSNLMVIESVPAWTTNRLKRLVLGAKRYLVDPALVGSVLRLDTTAVLRDGDLLGRLLDTFVVAQLAAELPLSPARPRLYHAREQHGRQEIDLIAELAAERVVAIEIKADSSPTRDAGRHLEWLADRIGDRFVAGIVLHTGPAQYRLSANVLAVPICAIWGPSTRA